MPKKTADTPRVRKTARLEKTFRGVQTSIRVAVDDPTQNTITKTVEDFIKQAIARWKLAEDAERYNRREGLLDVLMVDGEGQWDAGIMGQRIADKRPCIAIDRFIPMIQYIANEQRQARVGIKVNPVGGGADVEGAQIRQGLIRAIEYDSHAETVYDAAFEAMLEKGWSWWRVISEFEPDSFRQVLKIQGFQNDFCVYTDPTAQEPTRRDMEWAFICEDIPIGEYKDLYGDSKMAASLNEFFGEGDDRVDWLTNDTVRVAEYYYVDKEKQTLIELVDGTGLWKNDLREENGIYYDKKTGQPVPVFFDEDGNTNERISWRRKVMWAKINAKEILEGELPKEPNDDVTSGRDIKATWIPLIMVAGRQRNIKGECRLSGMVRHNQEAQRVYNYLISAYVEAVALMPKAPYVAAAGQIEDFKTIWDNINIKNYSVLPYKPMTVDMQPVPAPQRQNLEPPVQAIAMGINQVDNILKDGFNIFDGARGKRGSQESAKAMLIGKTQSESGNVNWIDNLGRSIQHTGEVLLDLMPTRYDAPRVVSIVRPDNERTEQAINQIFKDANGDEKLINMQRGKYSCVVTAGVTNATKRQESLENMFNLMQADSQIFHIIGDLVLENMDWPGADLIAARLKKALPPQLQDQEEGQPEIPPQVQQQMQEITVKFQELQQQFMEAQKIIDAKQVESAAKKDIAAMQLSVQERMNEVNANVKLAIAEIASKSKMTSDQLDAFMRRVEVTLDALMQERQHAHEKDIAAAQPPAGTEQ